MEVLSNILKCIYQDFITMLPFLMQNYFLNKNLFSHKYKIGIRFNNLPWQLIFNCPFMTALTLKSFL